MYGAPRRTARANYAWLTSFVPTSPYPVTPAWAQQVRAQPKNPPKFVPFFNGSSYLPYGATDPLSASNMTSAGGADISAASSYAQQATSFIQALVDSGNATATAASAAKRDSAVAKWTSKAEAAKARAEAQLTAREIEQSGRTRDLVLMVGGVTLATGLLLFFATRK